MSQICSRGIVPTGRDHDSSKAHIGTTTRSKTRNKNDQKPATKMTKNLANIHSFGCKQAAKEGQKKL